MTDSEISSTLRQARRYWYAGLQDQNPVVRFMHLSYSKGLLDALIFMADRPSISLAMSRDASVFPRAYTYDRFYNEVSDLQDRTAQLMIRALGIP